MLYTQSKKRWENRRRGHPARRRTIMEFSPGHDRWRDQREDRRWLVGCFPYRQEDVRWGRQGEPVESSRPDSSFGPS